MTKKVEIAIRIDDQESFFVLPERHGTDEEILGCHNSLDREVETIIRTTTNVQKTEWNIIRLLVATASTPRRSDGRLEILVDEDGQPAIRNPETGETTQL